MFTLRINEIEKERLLSYAEYTLRDKLHWGDGEIITAVEQILYDSIEEATDELELDVYELKILLNWLFDATGEGTLLLGEDISILNKVLHLLHEYCYDMKGKDITELKTVESLKDSIENI